MVQAGRVIAKRTIESKRMFKITVFPLRLGCQSRDMAQSLGAPEHAPSETLADAGTDIAISQWSYWTVMVSM
jgi:hypothetical protein